MSRVQNVGIDKFHFGSNAFMPVGVTLLNVLSPEVSAFE